MNTFAQFEQAILNNVVDLHSLKKAEPIKTREERRMEWLRQRRGKFTASEFHRLMANGKNGEMSVGAKTYAKEKAVELLADLDETDAYISLDMQWGIEHELEAIQLFTELTGKTVIKTGDFQESIDRGPNIACTPDGILLEESAGIEIKCPKSKTHFDYCMIRCGGDLKAIAPEYYWQVIGSMYVTNCTHWYFISYDPRFKDPEHRLHGCRIDLNHEDIDLLEQRLLTAVAYRDFLLKEFKKQVF